VQRTVSIWAFPSSVTLGLRDSGIRQELRGNRDLSGRLNALIAGADRNSPPSAGRARSAERINVTEVVGRALCWTRAVSALGSFCRPWVGVPGTSRSRSLDVSDDCQLLPPWDAQGAALELGVLPESNIGAQLSAVVASCMDAMILPHYSLFASLLLC